MQIHAYFKSVPDSAVEIRKFQVADWHDNACALRKRIDFEDSFKVDPNSIVNAMRCLYGPDCVIDFIFVP